MPTAVLSLIWIGLLIGVSFIATPAKFRAPSITMPIALDVGRSTFGVFGRFEAVLAIALVVSALDFSDGRFDSAQIVLSTLCSAIVTLQLFWLRPFLDHRVSQILDGEDPPKSKAHKIYIALEVAKLVGLAGIVAYS